MKLKTGDYIDLRGFSLNKKREIADWLVDQGNEFRFNKDTHKSHNFIALLDEVLHRSVERYDCFKRDITETILEQMSLSSAKIEEKAPKLPEKFKVRNGDLLIVREWLTENVTDKVGGYGDLLKDTFDEFLFFNENGLKTFAISGDEDIFDSYDFPELIIHTGVTGWEIKDERKEGLKKRIEELEQELKSVREELSGR